MHSNTAMLAQEISFLPQELAPGLKTINNLKIENSKTLWIASGNGLFKLEDEKVKGFSVLPNGEKLQVNTIAIDNFGNKWLGTYSGKLIQFKNDKISNIIDFNEYLKPDDAIITSIALNDNKIGTETKILLTTSDGQIFYYDTQNHTKGKLISPAETMIYSINYGYEKTIWLCLDYL
ncbi:MAG: hypothetical protein B6I20_09895 [Bacteroidetes bacterium 4572_117]|nr:MAG: hypothetical protein B6I20_09895 [Bacteroidetes bacterium 4572_117]